MFNTPSQEDLSNTLESDVFNSTIKYKPYIKAENSLVMMEEPNIGDLISDQTEHFETLNRQLNAIKLLLDEQKPAAVLSSRAEYLRHVWASCQSLNTHICRIATTEDKRLSYFTDKAFGTAETRLFACLDNLAERLATLQPQPAAQPMTSRQHNASTDSHVRLARLELKKFSGKYTEWQSYRDMFTSLVKNNQSYDDFVKLSYLKGSLDSEALDVICNLETTAQNFEIAWDLLLKHYDNKIALTNAHLNALFSISPLKKESFVNLSLLRSTVNKHVGALKNLGRNTDGYSDILLNRIVGLLDVRTKRDWELSLASKTNYPLYEDLDKFLLERVRVLESIGFSNNDTNSSPHAVSQVQSKSSSTVKSHLTSTNNKCILCTEDHALNKCKKFRDSLVSERFNIAKNHNLCINCLKSGHKLSDCKSTIDCFKCHKRHNTWLHRESQSNVNKGDDTKSHVLTTSTGNGIQVACDGSVNTHFSLSKSIDHSHILLATARVWVLSTRNRAVRVRALLDPGSTWTFISNELARVLDVKFIRVSASLSGVGESESVPVSTAADIKISSNHRGENTFDTTAIVVSKITSYIPYNRVPIKSWPHLNLLELADDICNDDPIHVLIGANLYGDMLLDGVKRGRNGDPIAQKTIFGWVVSGNIGNQPIEPKSSLHNSVIAHHCISNHSLDVSLKKFFECEELPQTRILSLEDEMCETHFQQTHSRISDGRYMVRIPFKNNPPLNLGNSRYRAELSLKRMENRLMKDEICRTKYVAFMQEYKLLNHMQLYSDLAIQFKTYKPVFIPHHPVIKSDSTTTQLRVVFNSSSRTSNGTSINEHMYTGPALQSDLSTLLLNWRSYAIVFTADIAKMYRQILVNPLDVWSQCILWRDQPNFPIEEYCLLTVTYGTRCAPFLSLRVLLQLVEDEGNAFPIASDILKYDTYIDDILFGAHDKESAQYTRQQVTGLLSKAKLHARKWSSNSMELLKDIDIADHGLAWIAPLNENDTVKILGIRWNPTTDSFGFYICIDPPKCLTKRSVLSILSKLFDPLGWISPIIIVGKIIMQQMWRDNYTWDDPLPETLSLAILKYIESLIGIKRLSIPRWTQFSPTLYDVQLHGFSDASEKAYGAVVYLRVITLCGKVVVSLLTSKTKVAPIKQISIPRLELQAALLLARLIVFIRTARSLSNISYQCWTDASIVLTWLSQHASRWKTFIGNRVAEIHSLLPTCHWRYVPTETNPADVLSRGKSVDELIDLSLWWHGPPWLTKSCEEWPLNLNLNSVSPTVDLEEKSVNLKVHLISPNFDQLTELFNRSSKWIKIIRVVATVQKFIQLLQAKTKNQLNKSNEINANDIMIAESYVIKHIQNSLFSQEIIDLQSGTPLSSKSKLISLNPYLDNGILRVGGRLSRSELTLESKHPIVLARHRVTTLLIEYIHARCLHGGVKLTLNTLRQTYWVLNPRPQVKSVIYKCVICAKINAKLSHQLMADLPANRVTRPPRVFDDCGIDYAGPLQIRITGGRGHKSHPCYIVIFVCFATKAIHLEIACDYTSDTFIASFKRFVARRGFPSRMYSDCGTNLRGADRELHEAFEQACKDTKFRNLIAHNKITWQYNPPAAPHFGGLWEAGVRSVKGHLKRIIGNKTPTIEEFGTLLCQIEAALNSRPLGPLNDHIENFEPLTPGHFLTGHNLVAIPEPSLANLSVNRLSRWQQMQQCYEYFWQAWSNDYLQSLQQRSKWRLELSNIRVGQLVLLKQPNLPPTKWLLGKIEECIPSKTDNKVRVVRVRTAYSIVLRPINQIALLPVDLENKEVNL